MTAADRATAPETPASAPLAPRLHAQLDLAGDAHELAPDWQQPRLFQPAPAQLPGQTDLGELA